jgi:hypothetical protein
MKLFRRTGRAYDEGFIHDRGRNQFIWEYRIDLPSRKHEKLKNTRYSEYAVRGLSSTFRNAELGLD